jgi:hypothetical protein
MKKLAFLLIIFPFLFNYSNSSTVTIKKGFKGNSPTVNFSGATSEPNYNYILPDSTGDTTITSQDTVIKS